MPPLHPSMLIKKAFLSASIGMPFSKCCVSSTDCDFTFKYNSPRSVNFCAILIESMSPTNTHQQYRGVLLFIKFNVLSTSSLWPISIIKPTVWSGILMADMLKISLSISLILFILASLIFSDTSSITHFRVDITTILSLVLLSFLLMSSLFRINCINHH
ncbi:Uncharacterised protein [Yersinia enterocolitica]|nr:Uncharacterised protein [Yersinia enterocolitica]